MIDFIRTASLVGLFIVGMVIPLGFMIYGIIDFIKDEIEINRLIKQKFGTKK